MSRLCAALVSCLFALTAHAQVPEFAKETVAAARAQLGVTVHYDPSYIGLEFPMGDVPRAGGVCTDVIIRALRDAHGIDLQALVHADMRAHFANYPNNWGLRGPDKNIDHRRVPNLRRYFERQGAEIPKTSNAADYVAGDIVTWVLPGNLTHIGIVSDHIGPTGAPLILHNIGEGAQEEDILFLYKITGHYRLPSP